MLEGSHMSHMVSRPTTCSRASASRPSTPTRHSQLVSTPRCSLGSLDRVHLLLAQGRGAEAEVAAQEEYVLRSLSLGERHPETLAALAAVVEALLAQDELVPAASMGRQAWRGYAELLGRTHPDTVHAAGLLREALERQGNHAEALVMRQDLGKKSCCGDSDKSTACTERPDQAALPDSQLAQEFLDAEIVIGLEDACEIVCWNDVECRTKLEKAEALHSASASHTSRVSADWQWLLALELQMAAETLEREALHCG